MTNVILGSFQVFHTEMRLDQCPIGFVTSRPSIAQMGLDQCLDWVSLVACTCTSIDLRLTISDLAMVLFNKNRNTSIKFRSMFAHTNSCRKGSV